ncbi:hypothetical protein [Alteromonas sp. a30]|uniref:hypothetical protein n=1 Tax=Alteromonas sp. a30 TaxID=2730917 RepID=UPI00227F6CFE|nr:hypothetical protein [Alteromonas sp. a30]MCY7296021.1 hypothetical protein [Alteromonas sp. a30]
MKKQLVMTCSSLFFASAMAAPNDLDRLSQDLNIMGTVLNTSLSQTIKDSKTKVKSIETTYLKAQGVVFSINTGHKMRIPGTGFLGELGVDLGFDLDSPESLREFIYLGKGFDAENDAEDLEVAEPVSLRERLHELQLERHDISYEKREVVRRQRDIEFELKRADADRKKELQAELAKLDQALEKILAEQQELEAKTAKVRQEKARRLEQRKAQKDAARTRFLSSLEANLVDTFCRYGSGLNALANDEKVNVIVEGLGHSEHRGEKASSDRIYVFSVKDIQSCVNGKVKPESLLDKAIVYSF